MASRTSLRKATSQTNNRNVEQTDEMEATLCDDRSTTDTTIFERLFNELSEIKTLLKDIKEQRTLAIPNEQPTTTLPDETQVNIVNALTSVTDAISNMHTTSQVQTQIGGNTIQTESLRIKQSITQTWNRNLEFRKNHYWQHIRNNLLAETYGKWIGMTPIVIPKKLQVVKITTETEDQTKLRERQVMSNYRFEIEKLKLLTGSHLQKLQSADENMMSLIERKSTGETKTQLKELWNQDVKQNETISHRILERKNIPFLESYEKEFIEKYQTANPYLKEFEPRKERAQREQHIPLRNAEPYGNRISPRPQRSPLQMEREQRTPRRNTEPYRNQILFRQQQSPSQTAGKRNSYADAARTSYINRDTRQNFNEQQYPNYARTTGNRNRGYSRENNYNYGEETTYIGSNVQRNAQGNRRQIINERNTTEQTTRRNDDDHFLGIGRGWGRGRPRQ